MNDLHYSHMYGANTVLSSSGTFTMCMQLFHVAL